MVTARELEQIQERIAETEMVNRSVFLRKMLLDGYVPRVDTSPLRELTSLQRRCVNNIKQIAKHNHTDEVAALLKGYEELWGRVSEILRYVTAIVEL
jgi:ABC-type transporter Mla MlaB component